MDEEAKNKLEKEIYKRISEVLQNAELTIAYRDREFLQKAADAVMYYAALESDTEDPQLAFSYRTLKESYQSVVEHYKQLIERTKKS